MSDGYLIKLRLSLMGRPVRNYTFEKPVISVGRDPGADVYVDNPGVSRDHFRLERTTNGEYQVVDLGSANGTFVNDQMVNASVVHNNDIVRFGKYTLWVGYEVDRRTAPRGDKAAALAEAQGSGHTVVLSRAELGKILDKDRQPAPAKVVPITLPSAPVPQKADPKAAPTSTWPSLIAGFILGTLFGAGAIWLLLNR
jgi:pSer/pThr/pTyr-binding forkhead associated (FHA) protein